MCDYPKAHLVELRVVLLLGFSDELRLVRAALAHVADKGGRREGLAAIGTLGHHVVVVHVLRALVVLIQVRPRLRGDGARVGHLGVGS